MTDAHALRGAMAGVAGVLAAVMLAACGSDAPDLGEGAEAARWWHVVTEKVKSGVTGRTTPLDCAGAPAWLHVDAPRADAAVHICAATSRMKDGGIVAELRLRSNRGTSVEVTFPGKPVYTKADEQPDKLRAWMYGATGRDPLHTAILPSGASVVVAYGQPTAKASLTVVASTDTYWAYADSLIRDLVAELESTAPASVLVDFAVARCAPTLRRVGTDAAADLTTSTFKALVSCLNDRAVELSSPDAAQRTATAMGRDGPAAQAAAGQAARLAKHLTRVLALWPFIQVVVSNEIDRFRGWLTDGATERITFQLAARRS